MLHEELRGMKIAQLTGSIYDNAKTEETLRTLVEAGAFTATVASRELVVELPVEKLDEIKEVLKRLRVTDVRVRETRLVETTITQAATGKDAEEVVRVSLAPAARVAGYKLLDVYIDPKVGSISPELKNIYANFVKFILQKAGVTDVIYAIELLKKKPQETMEAALEDATINAIMAGNGIIQINA